MMIRIVAVHECDARKAKWIDKPLVRNYSPRLYLFHSDKFRHGTV